MIKSSTLLFVLTSSTLFCAVCHAGDAVATLDCRPAVGHGSGPFIAVLPGQTFRVAVELSSKLPIEYNSALFRIVLTRDDVGISEYEWAAPFETGGITDFSLEGVELPSVITADTLTGPGYPQDAVDIEFGNFLFAGTAQTGLVVEVELTMPAKAQLGDQFFVVAVPDSFAYGFLGIPTEAGSILTIRTARSPDLDGDGLVNAADLTAVLASWGTPGGDVDGDGTTTASDLAVILAQWTGSV